VSTPADLSSDIAAQAVEPISTTADGQSSTGRSVADLIAADQYLAGKAASRMRRRGVAYVKLIPAGPLSDGGRNNGCNNFGGGC
jgi:hypothetical protein